MAFRMKQCKFVCPFRINQPGHVLGRRFVPQTCICSLDFNRHNGSLADKYGKLVQSDFACELRRPLMHLTIITEVAPLPAGQGNSASRAVLMNRRDQEIVAKQIMKLPVAKRLHQRRSTFMTGNDMRIHVRNKLCVQPGKLPDDFQFGQCALPEPAFAMSSVEKKSAEGRELGPANVNVGRDLVASTMAGFQSRRFCNRVWKSLVGSGSFRLP